MEQAADRILADWQTDTRQQLCEGFAALLENVGTTLVDFAAKTESLALQTNFFDAQQILERERARLLRDFCAQVELAGSRPSETKPSLGGETLSLLERDAYEGSVALGTIASNCVQRNQQNFHAFSQRISALSGGRRYEIDDLPLNPGEITACLEKVISGLDISSKVRLVLFTLFDRYVMRRLDTALSSINERLAKAGVLPTTMRLYHGRKSQYRPGHLVHKSAVILKICFNLCLRQFSNNHIAGRMRHPGNRSKHYKILDFF